jgi:hypothetical protein
MLVSVMPITEKAACCYTDSDPKEEGRADTYDECEHDSNSFLSDSLK